MFKPFRLIFDAQSGDVPQPAYEGQDPAAYKEQVNAGKKEMKDVVDNYEKATIDSNARPEDAKREADAALNLLNQKFHSLPDQIQKELDGFYRECDQHITITRDNFLKTQVALKMAMDTAQQECASREMTALDALKPEPGMSVDTSLPEAPEPAPAAPTAPAPAETAEAAVARIAKDVSPARYNLEHFEDFNAEDEKIRGSLGLTTSPEDFNLKLLQAYADRVPELQGELIKIKAKSLQLREEYMNPSASRNFVTTSETSQRAWEKEFKATAERDIDSLIAARDRIENKIKQFQEAAKKIYTETYGKEGKGPASTPDLAPAAEPGVQPIAPANGGAGAEKGPDKGVETKGDKRFKYGVDTGFKVLFQGKDAAEKRTNENAVKLTDLFKDAKDGDMLRVEDTNGKVTFAKFDGQKKDFVDPKGAHAKIKEGYKVTVSTPELARAEKIDDSDASREVKNIQTYIDSLQSIARKLEASGTPVYGTRTQDGVNLWATNVEPKLAAEIKLWEAKMQEIKTSGKVGASFGNKAQAIDTAEHMVDGILERSGVETSEERTKRTMDRAQDKQNREYADRFQTKAEDLMREYTKTLRPADQKAFGERVAPQIYNMLQADGRQLVVFMRTQKVATPEAFAENMLQRAATEFKAEKVVAYRLQTANILENAYSQTDMADPKSHAIYEAIKWLKDTSKTMDQDDHASKVLYSRMTTPDQEAGEILKRIDNRLKPKNAPLKPEEMAAKALQMANNMNPIVTATAETPDQAKALVIAELKARLVEASGDKDINVGDFDLKVDVKVDPTKDGKFIGTLMPGRDQLEGLAKQYLQGKEDIKGAKRPVFTMAPQTLAATEGKAIKMPIINGDAIPANKVETDDMYKTAREVGEGTFETYKGQKVFVQTYEVSPGTVVLAAYKPEDGRVIGYVKKGNLNLGKAEDWPKNIPNIIAIPDKPEKKQNLTPERLAKSLNNSFSHSIEAGAEITSMDRAMLTTEVNTQIMEALRDGNGDESAADIVLKIKAPKIQKTPDGKRVEAKLTLNQQEKVELARKYLNARKMDSMNK